MIQHDLKRVRVNVQDGTLHCEVHGLLQEHEEIIDIYRRSGIEAQRVLRMGEGWPDIVWTVVTRLLDFVVRIARPFTRSRCKVLT